MQLVQLSASETVFDAGYCPTRLLNAIADRLTVTKFERISPRNCIVPSTGRSARQGPGRGGPLPSSSPCFPCMWSTGGFCQEFVTELMVRRSTTSTCDEE
ncbi:hypothetical protein H633G_11432 [Metarhizium anisopliae BRIP 53284]|nr:hypothetical protein H633G_11432 [Metarhizium anisopliae BRIP 53284]